MIADGFLCGVGSDPPVPRKVTRSMDVVFPSSGIYLLLSAKHRKVELGGSFLCPVVASVAYLQISDQFQFRIAFRTFI
jgi:hypothetical protein